MSLPPIHLKGFHRYSTDARWHVPHFEKMLYDQGQLTATYSSAYQVLWGVGTPPCNVWDRFKPSQGGHIEATSVVLIREVLSIMAMLYTSLCC